MTQQIRGVTATARVARQPARMVRGDNSRQGFSTHLFTASHEAQMQGCSRMTVTAGPRGAQRAGSVGPKSATVGVSNDAARWVTPES